MFGGKNKKGQKAIGSVTTPIIYSQAQTKNKAKIWHALFKAYLHKMPRHMSTNVKDPSMSNMLDTLNNEIVVGFLSFNGCLDVMKSTCKFKQQNSKFPICDIVLCLNIQKLRNGTYEYVNA